MIEPLVAVADGHHVVPVLAEQFPETAPQP